MATATASKASLLKELDTFPRLAKSEWGFECRDFQVEATCAQLLGKDALVHVATGGGKTLIAAGPHLLNSSKGKTTILISPLLALHEEQHRTYTTTFKLKVAVLNSTTDDASRTLLNVNSP
jgi:superfamily II DNA helicase RecQ